MLTDTRVASIKAPASGQIEHPDNKITGLRLRVGATGKKTWIMRRRVGAKVINKKLGNYPAMSLAKAREAGANMIEALERDGGTEGVERTFGQVAASWIEKVAKERNDLWRSQERQLELHVYPAWKDRRIVEIKRRDVRELIDGLEGKVLPNRILALVRVIFRWALSRDMIEASPVDGLEKPKEETQRDRWLTMPEVKRIWNAAPLLGYPFGPFVKVLLMTAQRRGEVAGMRWADIDLDAGTWTLSAADTKAERAHLVPLSAPVVAILKDLPRFGEFAFTTTGKTPVSGFAKAKGQLDAYLTSRGEEIAPWRLHDLRRTAATHLVRLGISETIVGRVLNHAPQGVTAQVYALHSYAAEKRHALDAWAAEIDRAVNGDRGGNVVAING